ncbi:MAG TPA: HAD family hydrolase [Candidatus Limnocylindria bacterium]
MGVRAAFFDVGDTLVEHWAPPEQRLPLIKQDLIEAFGTREWFDALVAADLERFDAVRQDTNRWYEEWFAAQGIECDIEVDRLRSAFAVPLDLVSTPVPGAADAVRWCKRQGLRIVLVTNTLARGDTEVMRDWQRAGLADAIDGIGSSHDVGWRKPHRAMFDRALELAAVRPGEAFMVGDNPIADVRGAQAVGIRAVLRRTGAYPLPPDVHPDAVIDHLSELPAIVTPWL